LQNPKRPNLKNWFDANKVVPSKRDEIAQIIREKYPEKNFPLLINSTASEAQTPQVARLDSSTTNQQVSQFKTVRK
jgi:hypothetical protein